MQSFTCFVCDLPKSRSTTWKYISPLDQYEQISVFYESQGTPTYEGIGNTHSFGSFLFPINDLSWHLLVHVLDLGSIVQKFYFLSCFRTFGGIIITLEKILISINCQVRSMSLVWTMSWRSSYAISLPLIVTRSFSCMAVSFILIVAACYLS